MRAFLRFVRDEFDCYSELVGDRDADTLAAFPAMSRRFARQLSAEAAARLSTDGFLVDLSSGTTGERKVRYSGIHDEAAEANVSRLCFQFCGLTPHDRVVAVDVDSPDIYIFYGSVLEELGVSRFSFIAASPDPAQTVIDIGLHEPTCLITTPTLLQRLIPGLEANTPISLRRVIYLGEPMPPGQREHLNAHGIEVFSLFGSTETGTLGAECVAHKGIHLLNDQVVPSILRPFLGHGAVIGEVVWTTMRFRDHPLVKYPTGDVLVVETGVCECGNQTPRAIEINRVNDQFSVFGQSFFYGAFDAAFQRHLVSAPSFQIEVLGTQGSCHARFHLPIAAEVEASAAEQAIREASEFGALVEGGFVTFDVAFHDELVTNSRKLRRIVDRRDLD